MSLLSCINICHHTDVTRGQNKMYHLKFRMGLGHTIICDVILEYIIVCYFIQSSY